MMNQLEAAARQALEALDQIATYVGQYDLPGIPNHITTLATLHRDDLREALAEQPAQQEPATEADMAVYKAIADNYHASLRQPAEPVAFLANGTRFKISYDSRQSGGKIHGIPPELNGRWVALVAAEDDCHLKLTHPAATQQPLTDEQIGEIGRSHEKFDKAGNEWFDRWAFARAIEAAHGITSKKGGAA